MSPLWSDAVTVFSVFAVTPHALGGIVLRASPGPARDVLCAGLPALLGAAPVVRLPLHVTADRLLGGLSLAATLRCGRVVDERGLLAAADLGVVVATMAERIAPIVAGQLCAALDRGELRVERDGISASVPCRIGMVALDEGVGDECVGPALADRLAFQLDLSELPPRAATSISPVAAQVSGARVRLPEVALDPSWTHALCETACALGIASLRAPLLAASAARAHAALHGRGEVEESDVLWAARWVLGPRAVCLAVEGEAEAAERPEDESPCDSDVAPDLEPARQRELIVAAAKSGIPDHLLETLSQPRAPLSKPRNQGPAGRAGVRQATSGSGRPAGVRAAVPSASERLSVVETLRAAAPWQRLRERVKGQRVAVRKADLRVARVVRRSDTTVIFSVDASGSAALQRLAEAKGAVERVLIDCYARRDQVALLAFRDRSAQLLLPPTRSLARVRRSLAELAGGGATPLAAGIASALELARSARERGSQPIVVLMTDALGNVARDGAQGAALGMRDALACAREVRAAAVTSLFLDTSPRPRAAAQRLSAELGARYLPLPYLDAGGIAREVRALSSTP